MIKRVLILITVFVAFAYSENGCGSILEYNGFKGFMCGGERVHPKAAPDLFAAYPEANEIYLKGKKLSQIGMVPGLIGSSCLGWGLGTSITGGNNTTKPTLIIGAVGLSIGLPLIFAGSAKYKQAAEKYNELAKTSFFVPKVQLANNGFYATWEF